MAVRISLRGPAPRRDSTNRRPRPRAAPGGRSRASPSQRPVPPPARRSSLAAPPCRRRGGAEAAGRGQTPAPVSRGAGRARAGTSPRSALPEDGSRSPCLCGAAAAPWPVISGNFPPGMGRSWLCSVCSSAAARWAGAARSSGDPRSCPLFLFLDRAGHRKARVARPVVSRLHVNGEFEKSMKSLF